MLNQLFPQTIDNRFHGHVIALCLFAPICLVKIIVGLIALFYLDGGTATTTSLLSSNHQLAAAGSLGSVIPNLGLAQLILGLVFLLVLLRYRSMIPLMYALLLFEFLIEDRFASTQPLLAMLTADPASVSLMLTLMGIIGFVLSLRHEDSMRSAQADMK